MLNQAVIVGRIVKEPEVKKTDNGKAVSNITLAVPREFKNSNGEKASKYYKELLKIALPITLGSAIISLTRIVDMALIMRRLQNIGVSQFRSNEIYGAYTTLAIPIFSLIPSLITPISMALIPELTVFIKRKNLCQS